MPYVAMQVLQSINLETTDNEIDVGQGGWCQGHLQECNPYKKERVVLYSYVTPGSSFMESTWRGNPAQPHQVAPQSSFRD